MKLLVDEMYDPDIAEALRALGHDVVHASERAELKPACDEVVFSVAQSERRVIFTNNVRDFMPIVKRALQGDADLHGIVFSNDKSLRRTKSNTRTIAGLLRELLTDTLRRMRFQRLSTGSPRRTGSPSAVCDA